MKPPEGFSTASATPEQRRRDQLKALTKWLDRHRHSLSAETRAVFDLAPSVEWESPEQKQRREEQEARRAEQEARFSREAPTAPVVSPTRL